MTGGSAAVLEALDRVGEQLLDHDLGERVCHAAYGGRRPCLTGGPRTP
ncbi:MULTISPECIES: hypothetical protein [Streptomyces]|uniref:Uncharacterized protein n=1 Tax=Streptomyces galilaeus TaxID=33899 RepID=A0ABW9IIA5_STRGJ